jgi:adenosylcobyric acid synthase
MSNNSGVTPEGLEMGRAQIVQAEAAGIAPHVDMNPILLKPTSQVGSQVVVLGRALENNTASEYHRKKEQLWELTQSALDRLRAQYDVVIMEGAGSCAEINLMPHDLVNFRMAEHSQAPVLLVGDIHRGGIFAQLVGTMECLPPSKQEQIAGFIINRFKGDISLFEEGVDWIEKRTSRKIFGVLPWFDHIRIEAEDSVVIERPQKVTSNEHNGPAIAILRIPHISNFTDFDPLLSIAKLNVCFLEQPQDLELFNAVIIPGSKNTRFDLDWLHKIGWTDKLHKYVQNGGHVLGICGGYQMMGRAVHDPQGLEGEPGSSKGLELLPAETVLKAPKTTTRTKFSWQGKQGTGYEIHMGQTSLFEAQYLFQVLERNGEAPNGSCADQDGCIACDTRVMGTYIHGLFDTPEITWSWLESLGLQEVAENELGQEAHGLAAREGEYECLAEHFENYVDVQSILELLEIEAKV